MPTDVEIKEFKHKPDCGCPICKSKRAKASAGASSPAPAAKAAKRSSSSKTPAAPAEEAEELDLTELSPGVIVGGLVLAAGIGFGLVHLVIKALERKDAAPAPSNVVPIAA